MANDAGFSCLDCPVSGGITGAEAGTLTLIIGGEEETFNKAKPILEVVGGRLIHCGKGGAGQSAKICNNMLLGITMIGLSEAFVLAEKLGLDKQALFDVISTSSGSCW
jgi:3-hydroxyisobutyrate dehydrogenase